MAAIHYEGKIFVPVSNTETGEVSSATLFFYHQEDDVFWADYAGGEILHGFMVGVAHPDGRLAFTYQHINKEKIVRLGKCHSTPEILPDGRVRLHEHWQWLDGEQQQGYSVVEEFR